MKHGHLREHPIARFVDNDAARSVEYWFANDNAAAHRQTMHKAAIVLGIVEPRLVDAPVDKLVAQFFVTTSVAVTPGR